MFRPLLMLVSAFSGFAVLPCLAISLQAGETLGGWRGNGTGIWKTADAPPLSWKRIAHGAMEGMRAQLDKPTGNEPGDAPLVAAGQIRDWIVLGPFQVTNTAKDFDQDPLGGEAKVQPSTGEKLADREWKKASIKPDDPDVFGEADAPWLRLAPVIGFKENQLAYAHVYLYSPRGGPVRFVADHSWGLAAWLNGEQIFRTPERRVSLGNYPTLSRRELEHWTDAASLGSANFKPGWNRLLVKLSTPGPAGHAEMVFHLRLMDPPDVAYESENIAWMSPLPGRSTSTPILVGGRIFVMCEPDELVCLDKTSGKTLWARQINHYEALTSAEHSAKPAYTEKVDPLVKQLMGESDPLLRIPLRARIQTLLEEADPDRFKIPRDGHFDAHFGIVGFTMPTPVSDGSLVYVWSGQGVAACFDLDGGRKWITPIKSGPLTYASTPALADGVLAVFLNRLYGIDARTGAILWEQPRVNKNVASFLSARLAGSEVIVSQSGDVINPKDGKLLFRPKNQTSGDSGWSPGVVLGDLLYQHKYGVCNLSIVDFTGQSGSSWQPAVKGPFEVPDEVHHRADGSWIDRSTAASPLVVGQYAYLVDMYAELYVYDLKAGRVVHHRKLPLHGLTHYNALAVAASPALVGDKVVILDNQGTALVLDQGPTAPLVRTNQIGTQLARRIPLPGQEVLSYAPPIVDGNRLYLRGERYLYCIGK